MGWHHGTVVKALASKPDDPSSIPRTRMVEGKSQLLNVVL